MSDVPWYRRRRQLNVYVTPKSYEAIADFARTHGVTVAAVIETIGVCLAEGTRPNLGTRAFVTRATEIAEQRRSR